MLHSKRNWDALFAWKDGTFDFKTVEHADPVKEAIKSESPIPFPFLGDEGPGVFGHRMYYRGSFQLVGVALQGTQQEYLIYAER